MKISVVVPVRNEARTIRALVDGLLAQTRPPDEIVITDGGSLDATAGIIEEYSRSTPVVRLIRAGAAFPGRGRNLGAADARFEWLAFTDAGIRPESNWLEALADRAESDTSVDVVYGGWEPITNTLFRMSAAIAYVPPPEARNGIIARPRSIASVLLKKEVWEAMRGFPENLRSAEDLLFMDRVERAGYRSVFEPRALVYWNLAPTSAATFKRFLVYSRHNIRAGLWHQWQARILGRYAVLTALLLPGFALGPRWLWLPLVAWIVMLLARASRAIYRNRACYPAPPIHHLFRGAVVMWLLAVLDGAALLGSLQWLVLDRYPWGRRGAREGVR